MNVTLSLTKWLKSLVLITLNVHFIWAAKCLADSLHGKESRLKLNIIRKTQTPKGSSQTELK